MNLISTKKLLMRSEELVQEVKRISKENINFIFHNSHWFSVEKENKSSVFKIHINRNNYNNSTNGYINNEELQKALLELQEKGFSIKEKKYRTRLTLKPNRIVYSFNKGN